MASMIIVKLIGAVFKIPIGNILTQVGMAYFNTSYQLFTTVYALTVTGFSSSVARLVASKAAKGQYRDCRKVLRLSNFIFISLGIFGAVFMVAASAEFSGLVKMPNAQYTIVAMAPAILFSCMMASYRGYYEGLRNMTPTAVSQIVEVVVKLIAGLLLSYGTIEYAKQQFLDSGCVFGMSVSSLEDAVSASLPYASAAAMIGISISTAAGFLYIFIKSKFEHCGFTKAELSASPKPAPAKDIVFTLLKTALPITLSAVALNLTNLIDVITISNRLEAAYEESPAYFNTLYRHYLGKGQTMHELIYGSYTFALPFFSIVSAFTSLFGKSALPNVTTAWVKRDSVLLRRNVESVLRMTALVAFPAGIGLSVLSEQIIALVHGDVPGAVLMVSPSLRILGIAAIFLAFTTPVYSILQGIGKFSLPLIFVVIGGMIKIAMNYQLIGNPEINVQGAAWGSLICYAAVVLLSLIWLKRTSGLPLSYFRIFMPVLLAALFSGAAAWAVVQCGTGAVYTILAVAAAVLVYLACIILFRALPRHEVELLPKGDKIASVLCRLRLLK